MRWKFLLTLFLLLAAARAHAGPMPSGPATWITVAKQASTQTLAAGGQIDCSLGSIIPVAGSGGAVALTSNPQVLAGTKNGQPCRLVGTHVTNTLQIEDGNGLNLRAPRILSVDDNGSIEVVDLIWNSTTTLWDEVMPSGALDAASLTLQQTHNASGANPEMDVGANGLVISDLTSSTKGFDLCNADESQCWTFYVDATDGPIMTTKVAIDPIVKIPATKDYRIKNSSGTDLLTIDNDTAAIATTATVPSITLTTDGTGNGEIVLPAQSVTGSEITNDSITPTQVDETADYSFTTLSGKQDRNNSAVNDDDCTGEQGLWWYDTTDSAFEVCNANSGTPVAIGSGGAGTTVVTAPMKLSTINVSDANAFVDTIDGTNIDYTGVRFLDNVVGSVYFTARIPDNLAATPAWELVMTHKSLGAETSDLVAVLDVTCNAVADDEDWDAAGTALEADLSVTCDADGGGPNLTITTLDTSGDYDSEEALAAGDFLICKITRDGDNAPDTLSAAWLLLSVDLRITVNS